MPEFTLIVLAAIVANLLTPTVSRLWRCAVRYVRRYYVWLDSTQRLISNHRHWRKTGRLRKYTHRLIEVFASNLLDIEYIAWREAINKNNAKLFRQNSRTTRWERYSNANIKDCLVNPSYNQFLALKMDEDTANYYVENKPIGNRALNECLQKSNQEYDDYKREFDKHIEYVKNDNRYKSVLYWGYMSNRPPLIAASVYEEKNLPFPEDYHIHVEGVRSYSVGHIYRFINKRFPRGIGYEY